ncbi:hypothetical protein Tco_0392706 [Tanacetum coccineum]
MGNLLQLYWFRGRFLIVLLNGGVIVAELLEALMGRPLLVPQWACPFAWPDPINEVHMCKNIGTSREVDEYEAKWLDEWHYWSIVTGCGRAVFWDPRMEGGLGIYRNTHLDKKCMRTHSSSSNLVPPFIDPESVILHSRRNLVDSSRLLDFKEVNMNPNNVQGPPSAGPPPQNHNGPPGPNLHMLAPDLRIMEEMCQPTMNGRGGPFAPVNIQATDFRLKNHMIQQV